MLRPTRRLTTLATALATSAAVLVPLSAGATLETTAIAASSLPTDETGLAKAIVAFDGGVVPAGTLTSLRDLGVERAIELPSIGAVAVTVDPSTAGAATSARLVA